jgi:hypothetical protein
MREVMSLTKLEATDGEVLANSGELVFPRSLRENVEPVAPLSGDHGKEE